MSVQAQISGGPRVTIQEPLTGLEILSEELQEQITKKMQYYIDNNKPIRFGRIGRKEIYPQSNPPQPRLTAKKYVSGEFRINDHFDRRRPNKVLINNDGLNRQSFEFNDDGILTVYPSQMVLFGGLLTDDRNANYVHRNKSVRAEWEEVRDYDTAPKVELTKERTEHMMVGIVLNMKGKDVSEFAEEIVKSNPDALFIGTRTTSDIQKDIIKLVKKDPIHYARIIPSEETKIAVLVTQAIQLDVLKYDEGTKSWNFTRLANAEKYKNGFADVGAVSDPEETLVKFLQDKKNAEITKKIDAIVNPKFDLWA